MFFFFFYWKTLDVTFHPGSLMVLTKHWNWKCKILNLKFDYITVFLLSCVFTAKLSSIFCANRSGMFLCSNKWKKKKTNIFMWLNSSVWRHNFITLVDKTCFILSGIHASVSCHFRCISFVFHPDAEKKLCSVWRNLISDIYSFITCCIKFC